MSPYRNRFLPARWPNFGWFSSNSSNLRYKIEESSFFLPRNLNLRRMMEHGLLSPEKAKKAYERKQKRQQQLRTGTPVKPVKLERHDTPKKSNPVQKNVESMAKRKVNLSDDDDDEFTPKIKKTRSLNR